MRGDGGSCVRPACDRFHAECEPAMVCWPRQVTVSPSKDDGHTRVSPPRQATSSLLPERIVNDSSGGAAVT
eukprot:scaffold1048_cov90-Amphora_coffeaeformis.AAC.1